MQEILEILSTAWKRAGFLDIAGLLSLLAASLGGLTYLWGLAATLWLRVQQRRLLRDLHPFYTAQEIQRATQYYIETQCQNVAPSKADEPIHDLVLSAKEPALDFFLRKAFRAQADTYQFYIILADSGMGKTTFMINLYLRYINQFRGAPYRIKLFPLGFPGIGQEIDKIPDQDKRQTILLLDAFDEDIKAVEDYKTRLEAIVQKVIHFREVVITCRTQFFPREEEEPQETGVMRYGVDGGERVFSKFYLSPFDEQDIQRYLKKRFSCWQRATRQTAARIVLSCKNLMVRPMLLSYIDDLLQCGHAYTATYQVYAELINRWIEREARKMPAARRTRYMEELYQFSRDIAIHLYRQGSLLISGQEIQSFAEQYDITLSEMEMKSKSLLNRNARGAYKFSHKSILEYFLAEEAFFNPDFRQELDFDGMSAAERFFDEMIWEKLTLPFFSRGDVEGDYALKNGKTLMLTKLTPDRISQITSLTLPDWNNDDDILLFKGMTQLKTLEVGPQMTAAQCDTITQMLPGCTVSRIVSENDARRVFGLNDEWKPQIYITNQYENRGEVVLDHATGLMWQQSGSKKYLSYRAAEAYIKTLNKKRFAGYADWRLPTIPELMSLLEPELKHDGLYIDPVFDATQRWCWSADKRQGKGESSSSSAWDVDFRNGRVDWGYVGSKGYVRAVRS